MTQDRRSGSVTVQRLGMATLTPHWPPTSLNGGQADNSGCGDRSKARLGQPMPACCPPDCLQVASAKDAAAFNTHSIVGGGAA
jgi:hypothetical protein